jgi:hypothetical protein
LSRDDSGSFHFVKGRRSTPSEPSAQPGEPFLVEAEQETCLRKPLPYLVAPLWLRGFIDGAVAVWHGALCPEAPFAQKFSKTLPCVATDARKSDWKRFIAFLIDP